MICHSFSLAFIIAIIIIELLQSDQLSFHLLFAFSNNKKNRKMSVLILHYDKSSNLYLSNVCSYHK